MDMAETAIIPQPEGSFSPGYGLFGKLVEANSHQAA
jgi:hypothetical protein